MLQESVSQYEMLWMLQWNSRNLYCKNAPVYSHETGDISNHEQLAIAIRWVGSTYDIHEYLDTSATLTVAIKDILIRCILPLNNGRGQAYEGALNMMGHLRGVATRIQEEQPSAINVHCLAHCLNLCLISHKSSLFSPLS